MNGSINTAEEDTVPVLSSSSSEPQLRFDYFVPASVIVRMKPVFGKHTFGTDLAGNFKKSPSGKVFTPIWIGIGKHLNTENRERLPRDQRAVGSSLTGVAVFCP